MKPTPSLCSSLSSLVKTLPQRRWSPILEPLSTTPSRLLSLSLAGHLPDSWIPSIPPFASNSAQLPPGYHLVYFNPLLSPNDLSPDGTDAKHRPREDFVRRMWAGGSVRYKDPWQRVALDGAAGVCVERIRDVKIKGDEGNEKIFVGIERRWGRAAIDRSSGGLAEHEEAVVERLWSEDELEFAESELIERRNIVFMRERSEEEREKALAAVGSAPRNPNVKKRMFSIHPSFFQGFLI